MFGYPVPVVAALGVLSAVSGVHLWAQWTEVDVVSGPTQPLLMPLLALALWLATSAPREPLVRLTLVAVGFSWLGDLLPRFVDGDAAFLLMVGFFLLAQIAYVVAFRPYADQSVLVVDRVALAPYVVAVIVLIALCAPGAGTLLVPILIYGAVLGTMAVLATGVGPLVWTGGAIFLLSDALIAIDAFSDRLAVPHNSFWVMLTYITAQILIVLGVLARDAQVGLAPPSTVV